ncbi:MAG: hypothetical protein ABI625_06550 [bacterium]
MKQSCADDIVSNPTDGGYKRRAQERVSLRVLADAFVGRTTASATQGRWQLFLTIPPAGGRFEGFARVFSPKVGSLGRLTAEVDV